MPARARNARPSPARKRSAGSPVGTTCTGVVTPYAASTARIGSEGAISACTAAHCERVKLRASSRPSARGSTGT